MSEGGRVFPAAHTTSFIGGVLRDQAVGDRRTRKGRTSNPTAAVGGKVLSDQAALDERITLADAIDGAAAISGAIVDE